VWAQYALVKQGYQAQAFVNGVGGAVYALTSNSIIQTGTSLQSPVSTMSIGSNRLYADAVDQAQISNVRISKGIARYTIGTGSTYTVTTGSFPGATTELFTPYDPFTIYFPGRGQYWLIFGPQVFVLTINGLQGTKSWSRYIFPQVITDATLNSGSLFLRTTGNTVWQVITTAGIDDVNMTTMGVNIISTIQWPYLDMGGLGQDKMLLGVDLVGDGSTTIQIAYNERDKSTFDDSPYFTSSTSVTAPYFVAINDTVPGTPIPIPIDAPSYSLVLTFDGGTITTPNNWTWEAANFYLVPSGGAK
jgi:hypothetical protein